MQTKNYTTIATKISCTDKKKLLTIAEAFGLSFYELLQSLLLAIVRYFDKEALITYENKMMVNAFGNIMFTLTDSYNPLQIRGNESQTIQKAIVLVGRAKKSKPQPLMISKNHDGNLTESYNIDTMLNDFLSASDGEALEALNNYREKYGYFSLQQALHDIILQRTDKPDEVMSKEIGELRQWLDDHMISYKIIRDVVTIPDFGKCFKIHCGNRTSFHCPSAALYSTLTN